MKTLEQIISEVEEAGFYWALEREDGGSYGAGCSRKNVYLGDDLCGPGAVSGATVAEALAKAMEHELAYEAEQADRQNVAST